MEFVAGAFGTWLLEQLADAGRRRLAKFGIGDDLQRAMRSVATDAIHLTAGQLCPADGGRALQIEMVIDHVFTDPLAASPASTGGRETLLEVVRVGVAAQLAPLDDADLTGTGQSSADVLGVPAGVLAEALTRNLLGLIVSRGWHGGALEPLANQINHEATRLGIHSRIDDLSSAITDVARDQALIAAAMTAAVGTERKALELGPGLQAYIDVATRAANEHPYPGIVPGLTPPPLTAVYLHQQARSVLAPADEDGADSILDVDDGPAESLLTCTEDCILVGGPGAGKSSLLRTVLISLARRWQSGQPGLAEVPVQVIASDLVDRRPLPEAIAAGVTANLSPVGLMAPWLPEFFARRPADGVRWLVLVDGLDEVLDPQARRRVLDKLAGVRLGAAPSPYRFVVATRPLIDYEFPPQLAWPTRRLELQPFGAGQIGELAERWFTELGVTEPAQAAARFASTLKQAQLGDPARTPLMATMLCQLFAIDPSRSMPASRAEAYGEYADLLQSRQYADPAGGVYGQMKAALGPYGSSATAAGTAVLNDGPDLIARLAYCRMGGDGHPAAELLAAWTQDRRPRHVQAAAWHMFLRELLRRSGLLTERTGDFVFLHQTVTEFLAARYVAGDRERSAAAFSELFHFGPPTRDSGQLHWRLPDWDESYTRFLVAAWTDNPRLGKALHRLATVGGLAGCQFITVLTADGTVSDPELIAATASNLAGIARGKSRSTTQAYAAALALVQLSDPRGADLLAEVAAGSLDGDRPDPAMSFAAAQSLARMADPRGADRLADLATSAAVPDRTRHRSAEALTRLDRARGTGLLAVLASDPQVEFLWRRRSAQSLTRIMDSRGADLLAELGADLGLAVGDRVTAAESLAQSGDRRGPDLLVDLLSVAARAEGQAINAPVRLGEGSIPAQERGTEPVFPATVRAAAALARLGDDRAPRRLAAFAVDPANGLGVRRLAVRAMMVLDEMCAPEALAAIAHDAELGPDHRSWAAATLGRLDDPRGAELLAEMAMDANFSARASAVAALDDLGGSRGPRLLAAAAADPSAGSSSRRTAAEVLGHLGDPRGPRLLAEMAADASASGEDRWAAAEVLGRLGDPRGPRLLAEMAAGALEGSPDHERASQAVQRLITNLASPLIASLTRESRWHYMAANRLGPRHVLSAIAAEQGFATSIRIRAIKSLGQSRHPDRARLLCALASDSEPDPEVREHAARQTRRMASDATSKSSYADDNPVALRHVAETLAVLGDVRGADLLATMAADASVHLAARSLAAEALARVGDARAIDLLVALASDPGVDVPVRCDAAEALARIGDARGTDLLAVLASDQGVEGPVRCDMAEALARLGDARGSELLAAMTAEPSTAADVRRIAAECLARVGNRHYSDLLASLAADAQTDGSTRIELAEGLVLMGDRRGAELLAGLRDDAALDGYARQWASQRLARASRISWSPWG
jgi:HEAT repeat protein